MRQPSRRNVLATAGLVLGGTVIGDSVFGAVEETDAFETVHSSQLQYDETKRGNGETTGPTENLQPVWRFQTAGGDGFGSTPALADGTLYLVSNEDGAGIVQAVSTSGELQWQTETTVAQCSPAVADGLVFVSGRGGNVVALDAATGDKQWSFGGGSQYEGSPTVADGTLYVANPDESGTITALDTTDGSTVWSTRPEMSASALQLTAVGVANEQAYFGVGTDAGTGALVAVDAGTGDIRWRVDLGSVTNMATPTIADGQVFFAASDTVYAFTPDGDEQWQTDTRGFTPRYFTEQSPAVADGTLYFPDGDGLVAIDTASGARVWTFDEPQVTVSSSPTVAAGVVYVGTESTGLYALDPDSGTPIGQYRADPETRIITPPVAAEGRAYVGGFSRETGTDPAFTALESGADAAAAAEPEPAFSVDADEILQGMPVAFSNESDPYGDFDDVDGDVDFRWDFDDDGDPEVRTTDLSETVSYTFTAQGEQPVTLTVENDFGWTSELTKSVTVAEEAYEPPRAQIVTDPPDAESKSFESGETVTLDGTASSAGSRAITTYDWTINEYTHRDGDTIALELDGLCGEWHVSLTVTDALGVTDETSIALQVGD